MSRFKSRRLIDLEANLDNMNPEWFEPLADLLFEKGALDVTLQPIFMKKGRPGVLLSVLAKPALRDRLLHILFEESTTLGVRSFEIERFELSREVRKVKTAYGTVEVKIGKDATGKIMNLAPEYESCKELAKKKKIPLKEIYSAALSAANLDRRKA